MSKNNTISISASGSASAPYDVVNFKTVISAVGETGPKAKAAIKQTSEKVLAYVDSLIRERAAKNKIVALRIDPHDEYEGHKRVPSGYRASLTITFSTEAVNRALEIQDRLTEFEQSRVDALTYGFNDLESLREKAVENAWKTVERRFAHSRTTVGHGNFRVATWSVDYDEYRRISKVSAPTEDDEGVAKVTVTLTVMWKPVG